MSLIRAYVWNHKIVLPRVVQTIDGFFADEGPIEVFEIASKDDWIQALQKKAEKHNPIVETPDGSEEPSSAILEHLNIVKWSTFEHQALMYTVHFGAQYASIYRTGKGPDGMWLNSATEQRKFDPRVPPHMVIENLADEIITIDQKRMPGTGLAIIKKD